VVQLINTASWGSATYRTSEKCQKKAIVTNLRHVNSRQWYSSHLLGRQYLDLCKEIEN